MSKLFITPRHGYLGKTIDELRTENFEVHLIGYGYPPIYVEAELDQHDTIKEITENIDEEAEFKPYRVDLLDTSELLNILDKFTLEELINLCVRLNINYQDLPGQGNNRQLLVSGIVNYCKTNNRLEELTETSYDMKPNLF